MQVFPGLEIGTTGVKVDKSENDDVSVPEALRHGGRAEAEAVLAVVNGVVVAVAGTYAGTHSVAVTLAAGCAGVTAAALVTWRKN
jgi:hypothetical protein